MNTWRIIFPHLAFEENVYYLSDWIAESRETRILKDARLSAFVVVCSLEDAESLKTLPWVLKVVPEEKFHLPFLVATKPP